MALQGFDGFSRSATAVDDEPPLAFVLSDRTRSFDTDDVRVVSSDTPNQGAEEEVV